MQAKEEAAKRLVAGEVFYSLFSKSPIYFDNNIFYIGKDKLIQYWDFYGEWLVKAKLKDILPCVCKVRSLAGFEGIALIIKHDSDDEQLPWISATGNWYEKAEPISYEELKEYYDNV